MALNVRVPDFNIISDGAKEQVRPRARILRILHIVTVDRIRSGGSIQLKRLAIDQVAIGHHVSAVFGRNEAFRDDYWEMEEQGVDVRFVDFDRFRPTLRTMRAIVALRRIIASGQFDIVHAHKGTTLDLLFFAVRGLKIPIIANRGMSAPLSWLSAFKYRAGWVSRIVAVAENVKDVLVTTAAVAPKKVAVIYGGVDTAVFRPDLHSNLRAELGIPDDTRVIGNLGSLGRRKGIPELIEAFTKLRVELTDIVLVLVGAAPGEMARRNYDIPESVKPYVYLVPFRRDAPNCLAAFDIFVFSGTRNEGLTGAVREAAAMALPIITTDVGGNSELIRHDREGLLVPPGDSIALSDAILRLLKDSSLGKRLGGAARAAVQAKMTNRIRCEKVIKLYREVLKECRDRARAART